MYRPLQTSRLFFPSTYLDYPIFRSYQEHFWPWYQVQLDCQPQVLRLLAQQNRYLSSCRLLKSSSLPRYQVD